MTTHMEPPTTAPLVFKHSFEQPIAAELISGPWNRRGHIEPREIPADELAQYERAKALLAEIEANPFIHQGWDGIDLSEPDDSTWVYDETEEEHRARLARDYPDGITIPVRRGARP